MQFLTAIFMAFFWVLMTALLLLLTLSMGYIGIAFLLILLPLLARAASVIRRRRGAAVIAYLEQAVRLNLPLPQMMAAAQRSEQGKLATRLGRLSHKLETGVRLSRAVQHAVPELAGAPIAAIESGERLGRLPHALSRLAHRNTTRAIVDTSDVAFTRAYPFMMVILITSAVSLLCVFVVPKYETIFKDFGIRLPWVTQVMLDIVRNIGPTVLFILLAIIPIWVVVHSWRMIHPESARWIIGGARDWTLWYLPFAHGYVRDRGLAEAFDLIADALRAGQPIDHAVDQAANLHVNVVLRNRLAEFASILAAGASLHSAAGQAKLPSLVAEMLAPARTGEQTIEVMAFLARYYDARFSRTRILIRGAAMPAMVFFFAFIVAWVALSMMLPLTDLIYAVSQPTLHGGL